MEPRSPQTVETSHHVERANQGSGVRWEDQWTASRETRVEDVEGSKPGWAMQAELCLETAAAETSPSPAQEP